MCVDIWPIPTASTDRVAALQFTSCSSMETRPGGQLARLSHFEAGITLGAGEVAILSFVAEIPVPQDLYLDDEEAFGAVSVA